MIPSPKAWLKDLSYAGGWLLAGRTHAGIRVILLYHSVGSDHPRSVSLSAFDHQLAYLKAHFHVIPLRDLPQAMAGAHRHEPMACLTFDDGYLDNYQHALPRLEKHGMKASFFIPTEMLGKEFHSSYGRYSCMAAAQLRELASLGHEVGSHTATHPSLVDIPSADAQREIVGSKGRLEDILGEPVVSFAYPKGDYNGVVKQLVGEAGFQFAVTTHEGFLDNTDDRTVDWLALPRVLVNASVQWRQFQARLSGALRVQQALRRYYRRLRVG